jgi:hypothetical protein
MKKPHFLILFLATTGLLTCTNTAPEPGESEKPEYIYEMVLDSTMTGSTAGKIVDLKGFREFAIMARFEGPANAEFDFELGYDGITVFRETIQLNEAGWTNFAKTYNVFAPEVGLAVYHPPAGTHARISFYAGE